MSSESPGAVAVVVGGGNVSVTCIAGSRLAGTRTASASVITPVGVLVLVVVPSVVALVSGGSGTSSDPRASGAQSAPTTATAAIDAHAAVDRPARTRRSLLTADRGG
jgi:hypothetical protein